jgi:hypothetical protein
LNFGQEQGHYGEGAQVVEAVWARDLTCRQNQYRAGSP